MPAAGEDTPSLMIVWKKTTEQQLFNEMVDEYRFSPVMVRCTTQHARTGLPGAFCIFSFDIMEDCHCSSSVVSSGCEGLHITPGTLR